MTAAAPAAPFPPLFVVDAFTAEPFRGNPAGVVLLTEARPPEWMQRVGAELHLSETAFTRPLPGGVFELRWFTPTVEVELCGHATLAAAHVVWEEGLVTPGDPVRFDTASGLLTCRTDDGEIRMDFPAEPAVPLPPGEVPPGLAGALGVTPLTVARNRFDLLVEVAHPDDVVGANPDVAAIAALDVRGVILTAAAHRPGVDFVSRFFGPSVGIPEDPVTGSAHCALGPFWAERLGGPELVGYQASARGGVVSVTVRGDRVELGGRAVTVLRGQLVA